FGAIRLDEDRGYFVEQRKFAGHELDDDTGLTYMDARYYDSGIGRFISADPAYLAVGEEAELSRKTRSPSEGYLADPQALNSCSYARNNPLRNIDPTGEFSWDTVISFGAQTVKDTGNFIANSTAAAVRAVGLSGLTIAKSSLETANFYTLGLISPLKKLEG